MPLKVQAFDWRFVLSKHKSRSHLQQNGFVCYDHLQYPDSLLATAVW